MNPFRTRLSTIAAAGLIVFAVGACSGCSGEKNQAAKKTVPEVKQVRAQVAAVQKAKSFKMAFDNPKMGECPVCGSPIDYESFVSVGRKRYALCSDECAEKLRDDPSRYLATAQP
jgi:YHS domain-containing protein